MLCHSLVTGRFRLCAVVDLEQRQTKTYLTFLKCQPSVCVESVYEGIFKMPKKPHLNGVRRQKKKNQHPAVPVLMLRHRRRHGATESPAHSQPPSLDRQHRSASAELLSITLRALPVQTAAVRTTETSSGRPDSPHPLLFYMSGKTRVTTADSNCCFSGFSFLTEHWEHAGKTASDVGFL